mmetsp:Transcript_22246/g.32763  ORF Transcript_22246/g.32763 Transcript_22246/m.32763 type:complete len:545 (-) Transcript_22246:163-1797(-)
MIQALVDQPSRCLRDAHDSIDFVEMEQEDLSTHPPPQPGAADEEGNILPWMLVDTREKMEACVKEIVDSHPSELAFDLEMHNVSKYMQITCLLQLCTDQGKDYIIDVLAPGVWDAVSLLSPIFADPNIVKIGHCIGGMDVPSLHRDFGIFVVNAFDTYEAARALNYKRSGLATICEQYGLTSSQEYATLKKEYQNTDWRVRPLTEPMIRYGRYDVHFLVKLRLLLIRDLTKAQLFDSAGLDQDEEARMVARALAETFRTAQRFEDEEDGISDTAGGNANAVMSESDDYLTALSDTDDNEDEFFDGDDGNNNDTTSSEKKKKSVFRAKDLRMHLGLMNVISTSQERCLCLWVDKKEPAERHDALISVIRKSTFGGSEWNESNMSLYRKLVEWRDDVAAMESTMPGIVCSLDLIVSVAYKQPIDKSGLKLISYFLPELLADEDLGYADDMFSIVKESLKENGQMIDKTAHLLWADRRKNLYQNGVTSQSRDLDDEKPRTRELDGGNNDDEDENEKSTYLTSTKVLSVLAGVMICAGVIILVKKRRR